MRLIFLRTPEDGLNFDNFTKIAHKIAKSKCFLNIGNESVSLINPSPPLFFFDLQSEKDREYIIINATKRRSGKTCVIGPPLPKVLTIIDQTQSGEI